MPNDSSRADPTPACLPSQVLIWNLDVGEPVKMIDCHSDVILCMSFNTDGSLLATTCKDKKLRVIEPRSGRVLQVKPHFFEGKGRYWGLRLSFQPGLGKGRASSPLSCTWPAPLLTVPSVLGPSRRTQEPCLVLDGEGL